MSGFQVTRMESRDPDQMADMITTVLGAVDVSVSDPRSAFLALRSMTNGTLSTVDFELSFRGEADLDSLAADEADQVYSIVHVDRGDGRLWDAERNELDIGRPVLYPDWVDSEFDGCLARVVSIPRDTVRTYARRLAGRDDFELRFHHFEARNPRLEDHWYRTRRYVADTIRLTQQEPESSLIADSLTGLVTASMLTMFPNTLSEHLDRHDARPLNATAAVRRAVTYLDEHLQEPLTLADIAEASRLSARALQDGFRRQTGTTPLGYLRRARLDAARRDLLARDPRVESIADIAQRWGFAHLGRFARYYREAFGENPRNT